MPRRPQKQNGNSDANLQEQVTSLTLENERLKEILAQHGLNEILQQDARLANTLNVTKRARGAERTMSAEPTTPVTPRFMIKGCSCRGNCSTRVCGCVKKNISCSGACKCGDVVCQNQEQDKENKGDQGNETGSVVEDQGKARKSKRLSGSNVDKGTNENNVVPASKTRAKRDNKHRSMFSPEAADGVFDNNIQEFEDTSLRFGSDSEPEAPENDTDRKNEKAKNKTTMDTKNHGNEDQNLRLPKTQRQLRSLSNKEEATESKEAKKSRNRRSVSVGSRNTKAQKEKEGKTLASLINGIKPLRKTVGAKAGSSRASTGHESNEEIDPNNKNIEVRQAAEGETLVAKKATRKNKKKKRNISVEAADENVDHARTNEIGEASNYDKNDGTIGVPEARLKRDIPEEIKDDRAEPVEKSDVMTENTLGIKIEHENNNILETMVEPNEERFGEVARNSEKAEPSDSSPISDTPSTSSSYRLRDTEDFDPMKPTHNLTRSPIVPHQESRYYVPPLDISERPLPIPLQEEPAIELPPPDELNEPVVDWEKHQAERVHCRKCGRGFYPYRIKKHEASCQKL